MKDPWEVKEFLDQQTGRAERIYTFKRKSCKRVILGSRLAQQLAGYTLIEKDLRSVRFWLNEIATRHYAQPKHSGHSFNHSDDRETYNLIKGLFVASLTFYGKCFTSCQGRKIKLDRLQLAPQFREGHDELMRYRHNFAAHSGAEKFEEVIIALVFPRKKCDETPRIYHELQQPDLAWTSDEKEISFLKIVEHALELAINKIRLLSDKILIEEVLPKGAEYWLRK